jgi:hypothetical protein
MILAHCIVQVGNFERAISGDNARDRKINHAMKVLYGFGYQRFRTVRLPKNGDADRFAVMAVSQQK